MRYEDRYRAGGNAALLEAERFLMGDSAVQQTLVRIAARLDELGVPYAIVGGMALVAHGYNRTTVDVDLLVTPDGLKLIHEKLDGLGYLPPFAGSKQLRDTQSNVRVEFLVTGQYPGDGKPKPVAFPDPSRVATRIDGISYISLPAIVELKLASGMSSVTRAKDIGDVVELVRLLKLDRSFGEQLDAYVRPKFYALVEGVENDITDHGGSPFLK